jgi:hypothetical protein
LSADHVREPTTRSVLHTTPVTDSAGIGAKGSGGMVQKLCAALGSGVLCVAMMTAVAPVADADEVPTAIVLRDGPGDVWTSGHGESGLRKTDFPSADVTRAFIRHATYAVRIRMRFADLRRVGVQVYDVSIGTPRTSYFVELLSAPGARRGRHAFDGSQRTCRRMTHRIDYANNVVSMRIPRRCLGRPRWVTVGINSGLDIERNGARTLYFDNPHNHEPINRTEGTRRLYRG